MQSLHFLRYICCFVKLVKYWLSHTVINQIIAAGGRFGEVNPDGVAFYNAIIDALLHKGIQQGLLQLAQF